MKDFRMMKHSLKRLALVVALIMTVAFPHPCGLADSSPQKEFEYFLNEDGRAVIVRYLGESSSVVVPEVLDGYAVEAV